MADRIRSSRREHFGSGKLAFDPAKAVFINCPYDSEFESTFDAIFFATVCCGFMPRSALESGTVADSRMQRIVDAIFSSKYSIHDLSRCRGEGSEMLARFNMPLELGIAMARRYMRARQSHRHDWLLLVPEGHGYLKFASDLAGFDPNRYDGQPESAVPKVMSWLATRPEAVQTPTSRAVLAELPRFQEEKSRLRKEWGESIPWADLLLAATEISGIDALRP
jgi:hypothetical protein